VVAISRARIATTTKEGEVHPHVETDPEIEIIAE
jgi:hypothetical protein